MSARSDRRTGFAIPLFPTILPWRRRAVGPELLAGILLAASAIPEWSPRPGSPGCR
jgi:hypothetical protein